MNIFIALIGIVLGSIFTSIYFFIVSKNKKIKRIDAFITSIIPLSKFSKDITLKNNNFSPIFITEIYLINNCNHAVKNFQTIIRFGKKAKVIDHNIITKPHIGFKKVELNHLDDNCISISSELINPHDRILIKLTYTDRKSGKFKVFMKNENVESKIFHYQNAKKDFEQLYVNSNFAYSSFGVIRHLFDFIKLIKKNIV